VIVEFSSLITRQIFHRGEKPGWRGPIPIYLGERRTLGASDRSRVEAVHHSLSRPRSRPIAKRLFGGLNPVRVWPPGAGARSFRWCCTNAEDSRLDVFQYRNTATLPPV